MSRLHMITEEILQTKEAHILREGVSERELDEFEFLNGICLPAAYREWFEFSNGGEINVSGVILYSLEELKDRNGKEFRRNLFSIPPRYLIIGELNFGDYICIDLAADQKVIQWDHETDQVFCYWDDFCDWLTDQLFDLR